MEFYIKTLEVTDQESALTEELEEKRNKYSDVLHQHLESEIGKHIEDLDRVTNAIIRQNSSLKGSSCTFEALAVSIEVQYEDEDNEPESHYFNIEGDEWIALLKGEDRRSKISNIFDKKP